MSHLSLDARAILEYLNELGYRNISAEQLKEFLKGMQPQPEYTNYNNNINSNSKTAATTNKCNKQQHIQPEQLEPKGEKLPEEGAIAPQQQQPPLPSHNRSESRSTKSITAASINSRPRVIKSKQPLLNFRFYLDIRDHQLTKRIEKQIHTLGGTLEFFLNANVTHFITDKAEITANVLSGTVAQLQNGPQTPQTPLTQLNTVETLDAKNATTPTGKISGKGPQTRADAILSRVRLQGQTAVVTTTPTLPTPTKTISTNIESEKLPEQLTNYKVWHTENALHFFKKVQHELKAYLQPELQKEQQCHKLGKGATTTTSGSDAISLKGGYIKIESIKRNCRPYYQLFRKPASDWPKIELTSDDGAFRLSTKKANKNNNNNVMTRKSRSRNSQCATPLPAAVQALRKHATPTPATAATSARAGISTCRQAKESSDKQCGVCEICKIEYDTLTIHLKTKDHEYFAKNPQNFIALDTLIESSADVHKFLNDDMTSNNAMQEMEVEEQELPLADVNAQDPLSVSIGSKQACGSAVSTPSPLLREKSKRTTKGKHSSEKFQKATPPRKKNISVKKTVNLSSPVRPLLPPSSLYKVVESTPLDCMPRRGRLVDDSIGQSATASPSLIVKFKKVRQTELHRLSGEAESFMFPKQQQISSDLPTDVDRHSSSERLNGNNCSSSSLESSSSSANELLQKEEEVTLNKRRSQSLAIIRKQSFQNAPIQPAVQLKRICKQQRAQKKDKPQESTELSPPSAAAAIVAATAKITLPAATRKSSRTATAIVSAATTSSRLLRAAAEVVKKSSNKSSVAKRNTINSKTTPITKDEINNSAPTTPTTSNRMRSCRLAANVAIGKMEDRMGDGSELNTDDDHDDNNVKLKQTLQKRQVVAKKLASRDKNNDDDDDEDDDDDDDDIDIDDAADKDYMYKFKKREITPEPTIINRRRGKRRTQLELLCSAADIKIDDKLTTPEKTLQKPKAITAAKRSPKEVKKTKSFMRTFDITKSDRLTQLRYAFERVPVTDLWYRVFARQDACEERYFEYYGGTEYHKLPYELGPIPYYHTAKGSECCKLCQPKIEQDKIMNVKQESSINNVQNKTTPAETTKMASTTTAATTVDKPTYTLKHKKLHLLQRYRQEQEALQQQQQRQEQEEQLHTITSEQVVSCEIRSESTTRMNVNGAESKTCSPERELLACEREGSTTSSCASSVITNGTSNVKLAFRNKLLNKAAFLSLELPPRKSPREHASTLALVSCIIKQRQESKPNSDADETISIPTTPIPNLLKDEPTISENNSTKPTETPNTLVDTRPAAVTPVEEMCFATEISENVKRMRRGRNKYDHSPPYVVNTPRRIARQKLNSAFIINKQQKQLSPKHRHRIINKLRKVANTSACIHSKPLDALKNKKGTNLPPSIRKTGQKKGVLEFEVDETALQTLDASLLPVKSVRTLELEIDQFLETSGKDLDMDLDLFNNREFEQQNDIHLESKKNEVVNTPPATDYFSSDFDLCDLINNTPDSSKSTKGQTRLKSKPVPLFNAMALNTYFRKRRYMKSNRTGWPKVQKKKYSMRHQAACILFEKQGKNTMNSEKKICANDKLTDVVSERQNSTVITPPDSESDAGIPVKEQMIVAACEDDEVIEPDKKLDAMAEVEHENAVYDGEESIPEDEDVETLVYSEEQDHEPANAVELEEADLDEDEKAVEADDEEELHDAEHEDDEHVEQLKEGKLCNDEDEDLVRDANVEQDVENEHSEQTDDEEAEDYIPKRKRAKRNSSLGKALANCFGALSKRQHLEEIEDANLLTATTTTPTAHSQRGLRRTPQMNGSLLSCNSPSERAEENSDIFTVSSDGLDTDLDLSNPHAHSKAEEHHTCTNKPTISTKSKKYDISKYVPNPAANTCAAEAATAAAKSLAIAQFLKKEVRVTCRRIRAPFRRFRYRR